MAHKLFIPRLGTILLLSEDWTFKLYFERRNSTLMKVFANPNSDSNDPDRKWHRWRWGGFVPEDFDGTKVEVGNDRAMSDEQLDRAYASFRATNSEDAPWIRVTLPKDTTLTVDRIYIRRGGEAFDSVSFRIPKNKKLPPELAKFGGVRFWVKLNDANEIVCDAVG